MPINFFLKSYVEFCLSSKCCSVTQSCPTLCNPMECGMQFFTNSWSLLNLSIQLVMPSSHLIPCCSLLPPSVFPSIKVFSNELALHIRWLKYWSFSFNISLTNEHSLLQDGLVGSPFSPRDSQESSPTPQLKSIHSLVLSLLYGPALTTVRDY